MKRAMPLILLLLLFVAGGVAAALVLTDPAEQAPPTNVDHLALEAPMPTGQPANQPLEAPERAPQSEAPTPEAPETERDFKPAAKAPQSKPVAALAPTAAGPAEPDIAGLLEDLDDIRKILEQEVINDPALRPVRFSGTVTDHLGAGVEGATISIDYTQAGWG